MGGLFLPVPVSCPVLFPLPPKVFGTGIRFWFFGLCFCPGVLWLGVGGDHALLCMVFFCCCSVVFSFLFPSGSDDRRGRGEDSWIWRGSVTGLAGGSPGFFNSVRLVCFGAFFAPFFLRCFVGAFALPTCLPAPS